MGTLMRNKEGVNGCLPGTCCQKIGDFAWQQACGTQYIVLVHSLQARVIDQVLGQILSCPTHFLSYQEPWG